MPGLTRAVADSALRSALEAISADPSAHQAPVLPRIRRPFRDNSTQSLQGVPTIRGNIVRGLRKCPRRAQDHRVVGIVVRVAEHVCYEGHSRRRVRPIRVRVRVYDYEEDYCTHDMPRGLFRAFVNYHREGNQPEIHTEEEWLA